MHKKKYIIVAVDENNGIGANNKIPWHFKKEFEYFKMRTLAVHDPNKKNALIMGQLTWESLPDSSRPLKDRINIVLTNLDVYEADGAIVTHSFPEAIAAAEDDDRVEKIFFCGGASVYAQALELVDGLYITQVKKDYKCDRFFPEIPEYFETVKKLGSDEEKGVKFDFMLYEKSEE
jgi:dihydrofolate reductase